DETTDAKISTVIRRDLLILYKFIECDNYRFITELIELLVKYQKPDSFYNFTDSSISSDMNLEMT
ncbi:13085_t:CDS:2, partial [Dentiscutata heterogama]